MQGTMIWFNEVKGHGFILTEEGERLYAGGPDFPDGPPTGYCSGISVAFRLSANGVRKAEDIHVLVQDAPRRARRRHAGSGVRH